MSKQIALIVGSLRKDSWSRKLAKALIALAPSSLELSLIEIAPLQPYNQDPDDEGHPHKEWTRFRESLKTVDGFLFVTPEYNRSIPGVLKNALDVGSRPYGASVWGGKPGAVISCSPGAIGGFGANQHLRQTFVFLDIRCMQQPEAYLAAVNTIFDEKGRLANDKTREFLQHYIESFAKWVDYFG